MRAESKREEDEGRKGGGREEGRRKGGREGGRERRREVGDTLAWCYSDD